MNKIYINIKKLSKILNTLNTFVLMFIIFLFIFVPIGVVKRLLTRSYFFKYDDKLLSYFKNSNLKKNTKLKDYYEKPF